MKISCNIIKDLLPLYIDNISSEESNNLIEEHFAECEDCTEYFNNMKEEVKVSSIDEKKAIKKFFSKIKKKRFISIILSVIVTLILASILFNILNNTEFSMKYEEELITIEEKDRGEFIANVNTINYSVCQVILEDNYDGTVDVFITLKQTLMDKFYPNEEFKSFGLATKCYKNYINENIDTNWLWENGKGKITLNIHNDVEIANIYYIENMDEFTTILRSNETGDPAFDMKKIWGNK